MNLTRPRLTLLSIGLGLCLSSPGRAEEDSCPFSYAWSPHSTNINSVGFASAPAHDTGFNPQGNSYSYFAKGNTVFAVRNIPDGDGPAGSIKWTWQTPGLAPIDTVPTPVPLSPAAGPREVIFVAAADGFLYKLDTDGVVMDFVDTRRVGFGGVLLCPGDGLATPVVQLYSFANLAFKNAIDAIPGHVGDDLVMVITRNGCGDTTQNRIIAYWASDLTLKAIFNSDSLTGVKVGHGTGCTIDYDSDTLFCGTRRDTTSVGQDSLFALGTTTNWSFPKWSANAGSIFSQIVLHNGRLYVANASGTVQAYDPAGNGLGGATLLWTLQVASTGASVHRNMWPIGDSLLVVDSNSVLRRVRDTGASGTVLWAVAPTAATSFTSAPVAVGSVNKVYIGRGDGAVQEFDLETGQPGMRVIVGAPFSQVFDPSLDIEGVAPDFNRLVVVAGAGLGRVTRLTLPFCQAQPPVPMTVTITATASTASEGGASGEFTVSRSGSTATALTVSYSVGGTATPGTDYTVLSGVAIIPAGQLTAAIPVAPIDDDLVEPDETVVVTLSASASYTLGDPASAMITVSSDDVDVAEQLLFLAGSGPLANPPTLFFSGAPPAGSSPRHKDSPGVTFAGGNAWKPVGTWSDSAGLINRELVSLSDLHVWLGLKNSDDQGTRFDLRAAVYKNGVLVTAGETLCIQDVTRNPSHAREATVPFVLFDPVQIDSPADVFSLTLFTRIGTNGAGASCGGHSTAVGLRAYFDSANRPAGLTATVR